MAEFAISKHYYVAYLLAIAAYIDVSWDCSSYNLAACLTISREDYSLMEFYAILNAKCWNLSRVLPNYFLVFMYFTAYSLANAAPPREHDAMLILPPSRPFMAILNP